VTASTPETAGPASAPRALSLRKRLSRRLRHVVRRVISHGEYQRLLTLKDRYRGQRCFLLANGPSLAEMDLSRLAHEPVCVVNMGIKALDQGLPQASFHLITDNNRYRRFAQECEDYAIRHGIGARFFPFACRDTWRGLARQANRPYYLLSNPARFVDRGMVSDPRDGYSGGATVLLSAVQLLYFLGFESVYVMGCDLDYGGSGKYFYQLDAKDEVHEADPKVMARRHEMVLANDQFRIARRFYEENGRQLANAGVGGNLTTLPRVDFASLF
jgi:hypothetical protein